VHAALTGYCGNDFGAIEAVPPAGLATAATVVRQAGRMLAADGYRGVFGADLVLSEGRAVLVDLNPRFQGSTCLLSEIQALTGERSVAEWHAAEFVITGGVPRRGLSLRPGAQVCRLAFRQRIYDPWSRELTAFARAAIAAARSRLAEGAATSAGGGAAARAAINVEYTGGQEQC
jgi:biotin carboxylase